MSQAGVQEETEGPAEARAAAAAPAAVVDAKPPARAAVAQHGGRGCTPVATPLRSRDDTWLQPPPCGREEPRPRSSECTSLEPPPRSSNSNSPEPPPSMSEEPRPSSSEPTSLECPPRSSEAAPPLPPLTSSEAESVEPPALSSPEHMQPGLALPRSYLLVHNVAKRHNVGTLARSATAFGVSQVCIVGHRAFNTFGSHGAADFVEFKHCHTLEEARYYLKDDCGCDICGVEIEAGARPIQEHPFRGNTAFILGNEGTGLSPKQMGICDFFVYIPQYGAGTASLNVTVAASIVFHHFAVWARLPERAREGYKFVVGERPQRRTRRGMVGEAPEVVAERRRLKKEAGSWLDEVHAEEGVGGLEDNDGMDGSHGGDGVDGFEATDRVD